MYQDKAVLILRMPQSLLDALDATAYKNNISRAEALRIAVAAYAEVDHIETHGNVKYVNEQERAIARKRQNAQAAKAYRERRNAEAEG